MQKKRGQMALFLIIGVIFLLIVGGLILFLGTGEEGRQSDDALIEAVGGGDFNKRAFDVFMTGCLAKTLTHGVYKMGESGGYIDLGPGAVDSVEFNGNDVPVYVKKNSEDLHSFAPSRADMENALREFVAANFMGCYDSEYIKDLEMMLDITYPSEVMPDDIEIILGGDDVVVKLDFPVAVTDGVRRHEMDSFSAKTRVGLLRLHDVARWLVVRAIESGGAYKLDDNECDSFEQSATEGYLVLNGRTMISVLPAAGDPPGHYVVRFMDYKPMGLKYKYPYRYVFALKDVKINDGQPLNC